MRLREFALDSNDGDPLMVLRILRGLANKEGQPSTLPFTNIRKMFNTANIPMDSPDDLIKWANEHDPNGNVLKISQDGKGNLILNTKEKDPEQPGQDMPTTGPSVDRMAKSNSSLTPKI